MIQHKSMSDSAIRNRKRREVLKQVGLCVVCGREKSYGRSICESCQQKRRTPKSKKRKAELNRQYRIRRAERGVCRHCGREAVPGINLCSHHRQKKAEWNQRYNENRNHTGVIRLHTSGGKQPWWLSLDLHYTRERLEALNAKR